MSKYPEYKIYINKEAVQERVNRFEVLDDAQKKQLVDIIVTAKAEQLQILDNVRIRPLFDPEYSEIEPDVLKAIIPISLNVPEESAQLEEWEPTNYNPHPDEALHKALHDAGGDAYIANYYHFCSHLRHEYLLNKETQTTEDLPPTSLADKLIIPGHNPIEQIYYRKPTYTREGTACTYQHSIPGRNACFFS